MSSGALPFGTYHRASSLGSGTFGSVIRVYNEEGEEFALKLFSGDDEPEDGDYDEKKGDSDEEDQQHQRPIDLGTLREISCLRLLRGANAHPNITTLVDVQPHWDDDDEARGAGTSGCLGMALPIYHAGSLMSALEKRYFYGAPKKTKVVIAHGILSAIAFLHDNNILHRDLKPDNIMLECLDEDSGCTWKPILIDFSLAKPIGDDDDAETEAIGHTGEVGTVTYTAPEIVDREPYGKPSDLWSVGVMLLELLQNRPLEATKDRRAVSFVEDSLKELNFDLPYPHLLRGLLQQDPSKRLTARQALEHPLFTEKFGLEVPPVRIINVAEALPLADHDCDQRAGESSRGGKRDSKMERVLKKRKETIQRLCRELGCKRAITPIAAYEYCHAMYQLDDTIDNLKESQSLLNCVIVAHRFFELDVLDLDELQSEMTGTFEKWTLEDYVDDEATLFMIVDFCLYPRLCL